MRLFRLILLFSVDFVLPVLNFLQNGVPEATEDSLGEEAGSNCVHDLKAGGPRFRLESLDQSAAQAAGCCHKEVQQKQPVTTE